jgi:hypothetical protein
MNKQEQRRENALTYVGPHVDDAGSAQEKPITDRTRLVGFQCGFEPMVVAVHSYLPDCECDDDEAEELAVDYLDEIGWFEGSSREHSADFIC